MICHYKQFPNVSTSDITRGRVHSDVWWRDPTPAYQLVQSTREVARVVGLPFIHLVGHLYLWRHKLIDIESHPLWNRGSFNPEGFNEFQYNIVHTQWVKPQTSRHHELFNIHASEASNHSPPALFTSSLVRPSWSNTFTYAQGKYQSMEQSIAGFGKHEESKSLT